MKKKNVDFNVFTQQSKSVDVEFEIREFPWTEKQQNIIRAAQEKNTKIVFIKSCAGTGKTLLSVYLGLNRLKTKKAAKIYYCRVPVESCSHGVGFLPSDLSKKMEPYFAPAMDHLSELVVNGGLNKLINEQIIECLPIGLLKGRTINSSTIIIDEIEDLSIEEFRLTMSRLGKHSLMILIGDERQVSVRKSGFSKVFDLFNNEESRENGIHCFEFDYSDCLRSDITKFILEKFDKIRVDKEKKEM